MTANAPGSKAAWVDPDDAPELTEEMLERGAFSVGGQAVSREEFTQAIRRRGPQKTPTKTLTSIRLSPEVIEYFKRAGEGWQSRLDGVLKEYVARHSRR